MLPQDVVPFRDHGLSPIPSLENTPNQMFAPFLFLGMFLPLEMCVYSCFES